VCGICGKLNFDSGAAVSPAVLKNMADAIQHRGPDDEGFYVSGPLGLGFRRLSIIDLNTGHQPISNEDDSVWIVFNGEIYNYRELREQLLAKGHRFKSQTDTEVIVHLYEEFGENCVDKLRGMFAFAIWDQARRKLFIARDRLGIKPLYYYASNKSLIFGSEIKAILADPEVQPEVYPEVIDRFLTFYYVPGQETLFKNIFKLAPGCTMTVENGEVRIKQYWDLKFNPVQQDIQETQHKLMTMLEESVNIHMISDVPVGFLLSGGVDSTAMLGLAAGKTEHPLRSFTLGFSAPDIIDERPFATLAAKTYGSEHHEMTISAKDFADFLPRYSWHMEEPVCEPTAIALYYVSRLAKDYVKVLISGEGGDEAFAGYPNYRNLLWLERIKSVLGPLSSSVGAGLATMNRALGMRQLAKYAPLLRQPFGSYYYSRISSPNTFFNSSAMNLYAPEFAAHVNKQFSTAPATQYLANGAGTSTLNKMLYVDTKTALPDDLLLKADKMTMANSIELRVPLLDHKLLEFAATFPDNFKVRGITTKYIAKRTLGNLIPREILERKKVGFPVPFGAWMRTELKDMVQDVLLDRKSIARGYFNKASVAKLVADDAQTAGFPKEVLSLVSLELWHRAFLDKQS
jgi:asparagine synthase (glutamine-hydrolysing)